jgi:two-component system LytT family response regulator
MRIQCLVIDDEPLARIGMENYIRQTPFLEMGGSAADATEALELSTQKDFDLLFLDINMPKLSGLDFIKSLVQRPMIILVTAYPEFAVQGFELEVIDYLVKPVAYSRFLKAANKAREMKNLLRNSQPQTQKRKYLLIKTDGRLQKIFIDEIVYIEGLLNYVAIHTSEKKFITYSSLKNMEEELSQDFIKIHKSYSVAVDKITGIEGNQVCLKEIRLPVSKTFKDELMMVLTAK